MRNSTVAAVLLAISLIVPTALQAQEKFVGSVEYLNSCAGCHGTDGRGSGPVAPHLTIKPPDLTRLSERNGGQFPFLKVFMVIDGRTLVSGHGTRDMPLWGERYQKQVDPKQANPMGADLIVRGRLIELVNYLESIQVGSGRERLLQ